MINLTRNQIRTILAALSEAREDLREELRESHPGVNLLTIPEYEELVQLQDKLLDELERRPY